MGKILEEIGVIDGHDIIEISKGKAKKDDMFVEIETCNKGIQDRIKKIVNEDKGFVFAIVKKNIIKGIYLFEEENKDKLKLKETIYTDEVSEETRKKYDAHVLNIVTELVTLHEYDKVILEDKVVERDKEKAKNKSNIEMVSSFATGFALGFILGWIIFDDLLLGIVFGLTFSVCIGSVDVVVSNKRGRKKKKNK